MLKRTGSNDQAFIWQTLIVAVVILLWETVPRLLSLSPLILPPLHEIIWHGGDYLVNEEDLGSHMVVTLREIGAAYALGATGGISVGVALGMNVKVRRAVQPLLTGLFAVPVIALIPLFLVTLGIGEASKIGFGALYGFFPILFNTVSGIGGISEVHQRLGRAYGFNWRMRVGRILLPGARGDILNGLQIGLAITIVAVISAEMFGAVAGLGYLIQTQAQLLNGPAMWFGVLVTLGISYVLLKILNFVSDRAAPARAY